MNDLETLNNLIGSDAYWQVNKKIAKHFENNDTAILLADFISKQKYFTDRKELVECGYFFNTSDNIKDDCNISYHKQKGCINQLKEVGFIETKLTGLPAKLHFKIIPNNILKFLISSIEKTRKLDSKKFETNKNKINNNKEKTINNIYIDIFYFWNLQDIKNHKEYKHDKEIKDALKISTIEEIKQAIKNYKEVLESDFYFSFKWTLSNFLKLQRGKEENNFKRFLNGGDIWDNYQLQKKKIKPKQETYKNDLSKYDSMMEDFNKNLENFKRLQNESQKI